MKKIVIIGSPGAGKSTFARALGDILDIKVFHLDRHFWQSGWKKHSRKARIEIERQLVEKKDRWIVEGTYLGSSEYRLNAADTIIFLDIPPLVCLQRIIKRHYEYRGYARDDIPEGCTDQLNLLCILKVLVFPLKGRRELEQKLRNYQSKEFIWLHSSEKIEGFLAQQEQDIDDKRNPSNAVSVAKERRLVLTGQ